MNKLQRFLVLFGITTLSLILCSKGDTEFCTRSGPDPVFWINGSNCEFGILFPQPVVVDCLATTDPGPIKKDFCTDEDVDLTEGPYQLQYIPSTTTTAIDDTATCNVEEKCGLKGYMNQNWTSQISSPKMPRSEVSWPDPKNSTGTNDAVVGNQTMRLFRHLMGLEGDIHEEPNLRIVTLLKKSFQILGKFCGGNRYLSHEFGDDVLTAFMFLLKEADTSKIIDVSLEDYRVIDRALNDCLDKKNPFRFEGSGCKTRAEIESINTTTGMVDYAMNEFSWSPDKYDIPVDVAWATADFVHGLCYGTFRDHVNSHHLFEQAVEKIFTKEILHRWDKPTVLAREENWDNFFSANIRSTIYNLEFCIQAAYKDVPFLHRLERMLLTYGGKSDTTPVPARKRRSTLNLPEMGKMKFFCFNTAEERDRIVPKYKAAVC